jgi:hypothetical protein
MLTLHAALIQAILGRFASGRRTGRRLRIFSGGKFLSSPIHPTGVGKMTRSFTSGGDDAFSTINGGTRE